MWSNAKAALRMAGLFRRGKIFGKCELCSADACASGPERYSGAKSRAAEKAYTGVRQQFRAHHRQFGHNRGFFHTRYLPAVDYRGGMLELQAQLPILSSPPPEPWVDIKAIMRHLSFGRTTVLRMAREGVIPGIRYSGGSKAVIWRFKISAVDAALMSKTSTIPSSAVRSMPAHSARRRKPKAQRR